MAIYTITLKEKGTDNEVSRDYDLDSNFDSYADILISMKDTLDNSKDEKF